jgi:anti-sigma-K factor RskA
MPPDEIPDLHPDAAGWALGALDPDDKATFETHLQDCGECQATVAEFAGMSRALKSMAPAVEPPPDLGSKTLAAVQFAVMQVKGETTVKAAQPTVMMAVPKQEAPTVASVRQAVDEAKAPESKADRAPSRRSRWWHWHWNFPVFSLAATVGAAAAAAVVVLANIGQSVVPAVAGPGTQIPLHATSASLTSAKARPSGHATARQTTGGWQIHLTVKNLPRLGPGEFYECWYAGSGNSLGHPKLITAGTFTARTGSFTMWSAADPRKFRLMQITAESSGDPGQPGVIVLQGSPQ